ncbi:MAG: thiamine phosphate synthase [Acidobacteriota bacterium]
MIPIGRLHVITDETVQRRFSHEELAAAAVAGGADVVQYREKRVLPFAQRRGTVRRIVAAIGPARCVVNDDVELARKAGAWGVHLGPDDVSPGEARRNWPAAGCIGATANDLVRAVRVAGERVDYVGVGPVFATTSKTRPAPVLGLAGLAQIVAAIDRPVIAIGGIHAGNVGEVLAAGAWGVAVLSAVVAQADPRAAAARLRAGIERWLARGVAV